MANIYGHFAKMAIQNLKNCQSFKIYENFKSKKNFSIFFSFFDFSVVENLPVCCL